MCILEGNMKKKEHDYSKAVTLHIFFMKYLIFLEVLRFTAKFKERHRDFPYTSTPAHLQPPSLSTFPPE